MHGNAVANWINKERKWRYLLALPLELEVLIQQTTNPL